MLEIQRTGATILECHASVPVLDALPAWAGVAQLRVAADELLLLAPPALGDEWLSQVTAHLAKAEPGALVVDQSDGWAIFSLRGDEPLAALRKLAVLPLPDARPAFVQGAVAGGSAKLLLLPGVVHLLVPFPLRDHVERRLRDVCDAARTRIDSGEVALEGVPAAVFPLPSPPNTGASKT